MNPNDVKSPKANVKELDVLYTDATDNFSIASLLWDNDKRIAIRWNGNGDSPGFPKSHGKPTWFILPQKVALAFAISIGNIEMEQIIRASSTIPFE